MPSAIVLFLLSPFSLSTPNPSCLPRRLLPFFFFPFLPLIPGPTIPNTTQFFLPPHVYALTLSGAAQPVRKHDLKKKERKTK